MKGFSLKFPKSHSVYLLHEYVVSKNGWSVAFLITETEARLKHYTEGRFSLAYSPFWWEGMNAVAGFIIVEKRKGTDIEKERNGSPTFFPADSTS